MTSIKQIKSDLILLHAPSVYDFRDRDDILFGSLADSDSVNVTPIFEMYPLGFLYIKSYLNKAGLSVEIVNIASLMLQHPNLDVVKLLSYLESPTFGIDLHWMIHCQGSLELATLVKKIFPESKVIFGGISATYYAKELIEYQQVDVVVRGYDTLEPMRMLISDIKKGAIKDLQNIPNLVYKDTNGIVHDTGFSSKPIILNDALIDWSFFLPKKVSMLNMPSLMNLFNSGCTHNCGWCGGSRYAYNKIMGLREKTIIHRNREQIKKEVLTIPKLNPPVNIYTLQAYSESQNCLLDYLDAVKESNSVRAVNLGLYNLPNRKFMQRMTSKANIFINLSPESHDLEISKLAGRGTYTMEQMESWIEDAFDSGVKGIYVWFFIGMPKQTPLSIMETVEYSKKLMAKFPKHYVFPTITPMTPFLDPGSRFFEEPGKYGYTIFFRSLGEHRKALLQLSWSKRLNYETKWLSRDNLLDCIYSTISKMIDYKVSFGRINANVAKLAKEKINRTVNLISCINNAYKKDRVLSQTLKDEIVFFNKDILSYSSDGIIPAKRPLFGRWFDDHTITSEIIEECTK